MNRVLNESGESDIWLQQRLESRGPLSIRARPTIRYNPSRFP